MSSVNAFQIAAELSMLGLCAVAAVVDLRRTMIPNRLTLGALAVGLLIACLFGGWRALGHAVIAALVVMLVPVLLYYRNAMGGGDVKLFAAIGALCGIASGLHIQFLAFLFGAGCGVSIWVRKKTLRQHLKRAWQLCVPVKQRAPSEALADTCIPFAPCIFAAAVAHVLLERFFA